MGIINRIKNWYYSKFCRRELTPYGECLRAYLERLENGSTDHIHAYDETILHVKNSLADRFGIEVDYMETVNLMSSYFSEYF